MKPTARLQALGQSLWLDNITREMLDAGQLARYIERYSVTGLTSTPSIFDEAIASGAVDAEMHDEATAIGDGETLLFALAIENLLRAADLFAPIHATVGRVDGWVSLEISPCLAYDPERTVGARADLHDRAGRGTLFIKTPRVVPLGAVV